MDKTTKKTAVKSPVKKTTPKKTTPKKEVSAPKEVEAEKVVKKEPVKKAVAVEVVKKETKAPVAAKKAPKKSLGTPIAHGVGRRKCAVARVWVRPGNGTMNVNERNYTKYFDTQKTRSRAMQPFRVIEDAKRYDIVANVLGGGIPGQADAVCLGFARALLQINEGWRPALRRAGLLTVDSRVKERKKYGQKAARRKFQFVKR